MPYPDFTEAEQALDDLIATVEEMQIEVARPTRAPARAVELAGQALTSARRWQAAENAEREAGAGRGA